MNLNAVITAPFERALDEYTTDALKVKDKRYDLSENKLVLNFASIVQKGFGVRLLGGKA